MAIQIRTFAVAVILLAASATSMAAPEPMRYRDFLLGSDLATVAKIIGAPTTSARIIYTQPAIMQNLEWRPRYYTSAAAVNDPVDVMVFKFYDGKLFAIVSDYDRRRTEGMSPADMIAAISETYGGVSEVPSRLVGTQTMQYGYPDTPLAVWGDAAYSVTLYRVGETKSFRLVVAESRLEALARTATAAAVQQSLDEAPQREIARQKRDADAALAAQEKAKAENKAQFRP
jgi:hypothetical protein